MVKKRRNIKSWKLNPRFFNHSFLILTKSFSLTHYIRIIIVPFNVFSNFILNEIRITVPTHMPAINYKSSNNYHPKIKVYDIP